MTVSDATTLDENLHAKLIPFKNNDDQRILQSHWLGYFGLYLKN